MTRPTPLTETEIFERIDVLPPYFALTDIQLHSDGSITAVAAIEQPLGAENGPVSAAEAGRHLAICGSIAAAWANPKVARFHYLATDAEIRRAKGKIPAKVDQLALTATATMIDKRTAHSMVTARTIEGAAVCTLSCYYSVVGYNMMRKMYAENCIETPPAASNPYVELIEPASVDIAGGHVEVSLGAVSALNCAGHFEGLPAMPVAYLMSNVLSAASRLLRRNANDPDLRITVMEGSLRADGLAFAGEDVVLRGEHQGTRYGNEWVYLEAFANGGKRVGAIHLKLAASPPTTDG